MKKKITVSLVRLNKGGYDSNGKYWGTGGKLYQIEDPDYEGSTNSYYRDLFYRAASAKDARAMYLANMRKSPHMRNPCVKNPGKRGKAIIHATTKALKYNSEVREAVRKDIAKELSKIMDNAFQVKNPRVHFPRTARGRPKEMKKWHILRKGKPPIRFSGTKKDAHQKARGFALRGTHVVLDGPK
jgi:hypothetical protein